MQYLSLCAIVKNEAPYIEEWLKYHKALGVEKFYIYENISEDATFMLLKKLQDTYNIELNRISGAPKQYEAYEDCLHRHAKANRWILFIDVDEFIVVDENLHSFLKKYENYAGLAVHWYLFGSNGWQTQTLEPVVERFTKREPTVNPHVKCFVDPTCTEKPFTPHMFTVHQGSIVDENYKKLNQPIDDFGSCVHIQCNHYATKSHDECIIRRSKIRADTGTARNAEEFFTVHDRNDVEDFKARDFWRSIP